MKARKCMQRVGWMLLLLRQTSVEAERKHSDSDSDATSTSRSTHAGTSTVCDTIWAGQRHQNTGTVCLTVKNPVPVRDELVSVHPTIEVSYEFNDAWHIQENFLWIGQNISEMPQLRNGRPDLENFSLVDRNIEGRASTYNLSVPGNLSTTTCHQDGDHPHTTLYLVLHPVIVTHNNSALLSFTQKSSNTNESFLRRQGKKSKSQYHEAPGVPWMEFELVLSCPYQNDWDSQNDWVPSGKKYIRSTNTTNWTDTSPPIIDFRIKHHQQKLSQQRILNEGCPALPADVEPSELLTPDFLDRFETCSTLAMHVVFDRKLMLKKDYYREEYDFFDAFDDGLNDVAVVAKTNGVCYAVFRGTQELNFFDNMQNFLPGFRKVPGTDCFARKGFYNAYFTNYHEDFETSVRECVESCQGDQCDLVLSGGSQGAGGSVFASI